MKCEHERGKRKFNCLAKAMKPILNQGTDNGQGMSVTENMVSGKYLLKFKSKQKQHTFCGSELPYCFGINISNVHCFVF